MSTSTTAFFVQMAVGWIAIIGVVVLVVRSRRRQKTLRNAKASPPSAEYPLGTRIERRREPASACTCSSRVPGWVAAKGYNASYGYASNGHESSCCSARKRRKIDVEIDLATGQVVRRQLPPDYRFTTGR